MYNKPVLRAAGHFPPPAKKYHLYFDFEATETFTKDNKSFVYLIGIWDKEADKYISFVAKTPEEEINIFALLMLNTWLQRQLTSIENTRMKYSGSDFKMTSQANHLAKLTDLKRETERQAHHMQRLYKRRKLIDNKGSIKSNWSTLMEKSALDGQVWDQF